jgi:hypothetical protein
MRAPSLRLLTGIGLLVPSLAFAGGWGAATTLNYFQPSSPPTGTTVYLNIANWQNPDGCAAPYAKDVAFDGSTQTGKYIASAALVAIANGNTVQVYYNGCDGSGTPLITAIILNKS